MRLNIIRLDLHSFAEACNGLVQVAQSGIGGTKDVVENKSVWKFCNYRCCLLDNFAQLPPIKERNKSIELVLWWFCTR